MTLPRPRLPQARPVRATVRAGALVACVACAVAAALLAIAGTARHGAGVWQARVRIRRWP